MAGVAVVTDSTAYLSTELVQQLGVLVVPVQVIVAGHTYDEGTGISSDEVAEALRTWRPVTTSRPAPATFLAAYRAAAEAGATGIVSVHLSADISGTVGSARLAAGDAPVPVQVIDSRTIGMAMGYPVLSAAQAAADSASLDEVAAAVEKRCGQSSALFYVDTLEYLRRGGRIGPAAAWFGSALAVKPLLQVVDGRILPLEKVRTSSKALARLEELAVERAGVAAVDIAVHHLSARPRAEQLAERLRARVPGLGELRVSEVGAVVGAHVGPGMIAVAVVPR
ncbi:MAG TPA: DegV family protein [Actinomycetes bacterium]